MHTQTGLCCILKLSLSLSLITDTHDQQIHKIFLVKDEKVIKKLDRLAGPPHEHNWLQRSICYSYGSKDWKQSSIKIDTDTTKYLFIYGSAMCSCLHQLHIHIEANWKDKGNKGTIRDNPCDKLNDPPVKSMHNTQIKPCTWLYNCECTVGRKNIDL